MCGCILFTPFTSYKQLKAVQEALVTGPEPMELQSFPDINSKLSAAPPLRLEEVKALTVATDTFRGKIIILY